MATSAVDGRTLAGEQAAGRALTWDSNVQGWIQAHNLEIGFTTNPDEQFQTGSGVKSITQLGTELTNVGYTGPYDRNSIINTYASTTGSQVLSYSPAPVQPTGDGRGGHLSDVNRQAALSGTGTSPTLSGTGTTPTTPVVGGLQIAGNPWQWLQQSHPVLGVPMPGWMLVGGGAFALMSMRGRRR